MYLLTYFPQKRTPWNKGKLVGQKPPLKLKETWAIRIRLQIANRIRDLALFNLAIDSNNAQFVIMRSSPPENCIEPADYYSQKAFPFLELRIKICMRSPGKSLTSQWRSF